MVRTAWLSDLLERWGEEDDPRRQHPGLASLTLDEVAQVTRFSRSTVQRLVARGTLPSYRATRARRVRAVDLMEFMGVDMPK